jgi:raffinose/stachyose/melibiose transport system substrate-binding protein
MERNTMTTARSGRSRLKLQLRCAAIVVAVSSVGLSLAACAPGSSSSAASSGSQPVSTSLGSKPIKLTLYDGAGLKAVDDALIAAFEKKYPNITITARYDPDDVEATNAPRVLAAANPPDIARVNALGSFVKDKLLTDLDPYAKAYGWNSMPSGQRAYTLSDASGVQGSGSQYTMPTGFTVTGYYYNKQLAAKVGMTSAPTTEDQLESLLAKAKAAGVTPIMENNANGGMVFVLQSLINNEVGADAINKWVYDHPGATIDNSKTEAAAQTLSKWISDGYFPSGVNGLTAPEALSQFENGGGLLYFSGNWDASSLAPTMGDNVGFFLAPPQDGGKPVTMSDPASSLGIPAGSKNKNAAAAFLNFTQSAQARQVLVDNGFAPAGTGSAPTTSNQLNAGVQKAFQQLVAANGQTEYVQNATSGISATWNAQIQLFAAGKATPSQLLQTVQQQYLGQLK